MNLPDSELAPGTVGPLADEVPLVTEAMVRPYVVSIILHRGAIRLSELLQALTPHLPATDMLVGAWSALEADYVDSTRAELVCLNVLGEFVAAGRLRYTDTLDLWVADENALGFWVTKATELDATLPLHLLRSAESRKIKLRCPF